MKVKRLSRRCLPQDYQIRKQIRQRSRSWGWCDIYARRRRSPRTSWMLTRWVEADIQTAAQHAQLMFEVESNNLLHDCNDLLREENTQLQSKLAQEKAKLNKLEKMIRPLLEEIQTVQVQRESLLVEKKTVITELEKWKARTKQSIENVHKTYTEEHKKLVNEKEELRKQLDTLTDELHEVRDESAKTSIEHANLQETNESLTKSKLELEADAAEKVKTINQLKKIGRKYKAQAETVTKEFEEFKSKLEGDAAPKQTAQQDLTTLKEKNSILKEKTELEKELTRAKSILGMAKKKLLSMKEVNEKMSREGKELKEKQGITAECQDTQANQVHGKVDTKTDVGETTVVCEQCKVDNIQPAVGWCETCDELLYNGCYEYQCRQKSMKNHQPMSIAEMIFMKQGKMLSLKCDKNEGKPLEYFCEDHTELACSPCCVTKHRFCSSANYIADEIKESTEFETVETLLSQFDTRFKANEETIVGNLSLAARQHNKAIDDIKEAGDKLKAHIDDLIKQQIIQAERSHEDNMRTISCVEEINKAIAKKVKKGRDMLAAETNSNSRLFVAMLSVQHDVEMMISQLNESQKKNIIRENEFELSSELAWVLYKVRHLGTLKDTHLLNPEKATDKDELHTVFAKVNLLGTPNDAQLPNQEKATDKVVEVVDVRRFQRSNVYCSIGGNRNDTIEVSTDHDIRLLHVLVFACNWGDTHVTLTISEGGNCLKSCNSAYTREADQPMVAVNVAKEGDTDGITLQAGHQYIIDVARVEKRLLGYWCGRDGLANITEKGMTVTFSNTTRTNTGHGVIAGLRFNII